MLYYSIIYRDRTLTIPHAVAPERARQILDLALAYISDPVKLRALKDAQAREAARIPVTSVDRTRGLVDGHAVHFVVQIDDTAPVAAEPTPTIADAYIAPTED